MTHKKTLLLAPLLLCSFAVVNSAAGNSTAHELKDEEPKTGKLEGASNNSPRLEIKKYRFFHNSRLNNERLVLEFERRNSQSTTPKLTTELLSKQELKLQIENAVLLGAIPESLINDSYAQQSRYLGPITVDDRSMDSGLAMTVKLRNSELSYKVEWLSHPDRLVIDIFPKNSAAAHQASMGHGERGISSINVDRKNPIGAFDRFICFPAKAKVGLAVIFQPSNKKEDEIQKFRVHTDGSALGLYSALDRESIVCYPKNAEVNAQLSFQPIEVIQEGPVHMGTNSAMPQVTPPPTVQASTEHTPMPLPIPAPPTQSDAAAGQRPPPLPPLMGVDSDLDPGNIGGH